MHHVTVHGPYICNLYTLARPAVTLISPALRLLSRTLLARLVFAPSPLLTQAVPTYTSDFTDAVGASLVDLCASVVFCGRSLHSPNAGVAGLFLSD